MNGYRRKSLQKKSAKPPASWTSLFGMDMQSIDAERLERPESSPLCVV
jgi:hypothetical protein